MPVVDAERRVEGQGRDLLDLFPPLPFLCFPPHVRELCDCFARFFLLV